MSNTKIPTELPEVSDETLREADAALDAAIATRDVSDLFVLGFGEVSVAMGWPAAAPEYVLKRSLVYDSPASCQAHFAAIEKYIDIISAGGADVLVTSLRMLEREDGRASGWVVQPLVPKEFLVTTILHGEEPRSAHPVIRGHREVALRDCCPEYAVDLQISNFAFDGDRYVLLDVTSPVFWDAAGNFTGPIPDEFVKMSPAPIRSTFRKEYAKAAAGFRTRRGALQAALVWLHRSDLGHWGPAFAEEFNKALGDDDEPVDVEAAQAEFDRFKKVIPAVKNASRLQRWWVTTVRRGPYDAFITDSFSGELL